MKQIIYFASFNGNKVSDYQSKCPKSRLVVSPMNSYIVKILKRPKSRLVVSLMNSLLQVINEITKIQELLYLCNTNILTFFSHEEKIDSI